MFGTTRSNSAGPTITPGGTPQDTFDTTLPSGGPTLVQYFSRELSATCNSGDPKALLTVDGTAVTSSASSIASKGTGQPPSAFLAGTVTLGAGSHTFGVRLYCSTGSGVLSSTVVPGTWTVLRLGSAS